MVITREQLQEQIWGNTFVDFDQSLNKAINRVREALNDNAGTPQYVETIPRRGYRFIAPVEAAPQTEEPMVVNRGSAEEPARPGSYRSPSGKLLTAALTVAVVAAIGIAIVESWRQPHEPSLQEATLVKSFGWAPALSRDGKLLAYSSSVGSGQQHIWVQQTAGGEAIQVTAGPDAETTPDFSPDGARIAFYSVRKGGGITSPPLYLANLDSVVSHQRCGRPAVLAWRRHHPLLARPEIIHRICEWRPAHPPAVESGLSHI